MKEGKIKLFNKYMLIFLRASLIIAIFIEIYEQRWLTLFITLITIFLTFLPGLFERRYKIDIPDSFEILIILFIYSSLYLGEVQKFYIKFWWWDIFLHLLSAIALGLIGLAILILLYEKKKVSTKPFWISLFAFSFAVSIGAIWEIFEFTMDQAFGLNMQKSGLIDTMTDLIIDSIGALITSTLGYIYIKNKSNYVSKILKEIFKGIKK